MFRVDKMVEFHKKLKQTKRAKYRYVVHCSERAFIRWHYGNDLMKLTRANPNGLYWPDGVYELYDPEVDETYLYFDQTTVRYDHIRFAVNEYSGIEECGSIEKVPLDARDQLYRVTRGIDGALTLVRCEEEYE